MIKHALWMLSVLAIVGWLAGCAQQGATAQAPATEAAKPAESQPAAQPGAKPEETKPAEQPAQASEAPGGAATITTLSNGMEFKIVYFDFDKYNIKPEFQEAIKFNAAELNKDPSLKVTVEGHCDERGSTEYNLALGERRATAVEKALVAEGVDAKRMKVVSYGEERPVDPGHNEAAWAKNRRSVISQ